jgi:hypothetical protein
LFGPKQHTARSANVAIQGGEARDFSWAEAVVWTERMLSALGNGVKGGKWYALMDKVFAPKTLPSCPRSSRAGRRAFVLRRKPFRPHPKCPCLWQRSDGLRSFLRLKSARCECV